MLATFLSFYYCSKSGNLTKKILCNHSPFSVIYVSICVPFHQNCKEKRACNRTSTNRPSIQLFFKYQDKRSAEDEIVNGHNDVGRNGVIHAGTFQNHCWLRTKKEINVTVFIYFQQHIQPRIRAD